MNSRLILNRLLRVTLIALLCSMASHAAFAKLSLEGQNKGDTNTWSAGGLVNWLELDYIPCRVHFTSAQGNNQTITVSFEHVNGGVPGVQNLFNFSSSSNIVFTAAPTLSAPPASAVWSYTFTVNVLNNNPGDVWFSARLAAGAHLNTGSSLSLGGSPSSMGNLQVHKPGAAPGIPDLMVVKNGPVSAKPGDIITYSLTYSNRASAGNLATGVQLSDILPAEVTVLTNTIPNGGLLVGNTIYWDLPNLAIGAHGRLTFQVQVNPSTPYSYPFSNFSQILNNQDDQNYADNTSTFVTTTIPCAPPTVLIDPDIATNCSEDSVIFTSTVNGTAPMAYQWRKDGAAIPGATNSSFSISPVSNSDAGAYSLRVSNVCGIVTSSSAQGILTVNTNASATALVSLAKCAGDTAIFSTTAGGTGPFSYRWTKDGATLAETNASLTIAAVSATNVGTYCVEVTGTCGPTVSTCASLTLNTPVSASPLSNLVKCPGDSATFATVAAGTGPYSYLWLKNGVALAETNNSLTLSSVTSADAGTYSVVVSGGCSMATNSASLTVNQNVVVVSAPVSVTNCLGTSASFNVGAIGTGLGYQWFKGATALVGQTSSNLVLANVGATDAGTYTVIVSGVCGNAATNSASLTVNESVVVASAPVSLTNCPGISASFNVSATGTGLSYQWYKDGNVLPGQSGNSLTLGTISAADAGTYRVVVSGACGNAVTNSATLTVSEVIAIAVSPANATNCPGTTANFNVGASGTGLAFEWYKNGALLLGKTNGLLAIPDVSTADAGAYTVIARGVCGNAATNSATLTVNENLVVSGAPVSLTNCPGSSASFSVIATGTGVSYQWHKGASALTGQTGSSLMLTNLTAADAGFYSVVVSGTCGNVVTNAASLTVNENLVVSSAPVSVTNCPGASVSFSVSASGTGLSYQWHKGATALAGETGSSLVLANVSAADVGTYRVVVSGVCGDAMTNSASLTVNENVMVATEPVSVTNCPGSSASFSVSATGTDLSYQWYKGATLLAGESGSSLSLNSISAADAGTYSVVVSGACSSVSKSASLTVSAEALVASAPVSLTNCPGASASFEITASGTGLSYQWYKDGSALVAETTNGLTITNISAVDAGVYSVVIAGTCGIAVTNSASLTVNEMVAISVEPASATNCPATTASFSVAASGSGLAYEWYKNGILLAGQTTNGLVLQAVSAADEGTYTVVAHGICGNAATNSATLRVNENLAVSGVPASLTNCPGSSANFSVSATGTGLSYQWYKAGSTLAGQTGSSLVLGNVSASDAGTYSVVVSGTCGNAVSNSASLTVNQSAVVNTAPVSLTNCPGTRARFVVSATGTGLSYQWYKGGSALTGQTGANLVLRNVTAVDAGTYSVVVSGVCGDVVTNSASLTVNEGVLVVSAPLSVTNCPGTSASFNVGATGTGVNYQWYKGSEALIGQAGSSLTLTNLSAADAGIYSVVVSGVCGEAVTNSASLTVNENMVVINSPVSVTNCPGSSASFSVSATGTGVSYQWYKGASALAGQTGSSLALANVITADAGAYSVVVSGVCGNAVTNTASLTINENVVVVNAPVSATNCPGTTASFSVNATGTGPSYQWFKGGSALAGQTGSSLVLANVSATDAGNYTVVVSGVCGNAVTNSASLTVNQNAVVVSAPVSLTNCPGASASFTVNATGTGLSYQWYKGATVLAGQTGSSLALPNVSTADAGTYSVVVSGTCGNAVTDSAVLTVNESAVVVSAPVSLTNCPGTSASFSVNASGTALNYQWSKGGSPLAGQTASSLVLANVSTADAGLYSVVVSGTCGNAVTSSASLTVNEDLAISILPANATNCPATTAIFNVGGSGSGLNYQWYKNGAILLGKTNSSLTLTNLSASDAGIYTAVAGGICGNAATNSASLTVNESVVVTSVPISLTNCPGTSASFSVGATGTGLSYQWFKGATALAGQTGSGLVLANVSATDVGTYTVVVSGACGNAATNSASLTVNQNVVVVSAPVSLTNCPGSSASFSVGATGTGLSYQWFKGATALAGQTGSGLVLANVSATDAGSYTVVVSGVCGNAVTNGASLTVNQNVVVASAPVSVTNCPGGSASFNVGATGTGLTYQWFKGATALAGQTGSSLVLANVSAADDGTYTVVVSGACGNAATNSASLTVNQNVVVVSAPVSVTNCPGSSASFNVGATGTGLTYQWLKGATALAGQTGSSLVLANVSATDAGTYTVVVRGSCGSAVTNSASLTVNQNVVVISAPVSVTNCPGTSASFSVGASGTGLSYQWLKGATALAGQTGSSLVLANVSATDAGTYTVVVSGSCGSAVTNSASLTVNQNVVVASAPVSVTNCPGSSASFNVGATGAGLSYQWFKGATALAGQTGSSLVLANVSATDVGTYTAVVSGVCGNAVTNSASLTVNQNVVVVSAPVSVTNCPGSSASFNVGASGTGLSYQWFKGATALAGQTGSSLVLANVSATDAGTYTVVVSGSCGSAVTNSASLTVNQNVVVISAPVSVTNCPGTSASFSVGASGTGLSYQWLKGATALAGQTGSSLVLANVSATDAGTYTVVVSGACGTAATNSASLTVNQNVVVASAPVSVTNCPGSSASFSVAATGTALSYQWRKDGIGLNGATGSSYSIQSVTAADAGRYDVLIPGQCGSITSSAAMLAVNAATVATPISNAATSVGASVTFSTVASGTGPLTYAWKKNGTIISGLTTASLTLTNLNYSDSAVYTVEVSGACNTVEQSAALTVNRPPTVNILSPTNGTVFIAPANFTVLADAADVDGTVTNVQFFYATTNFLGQSANAPYCTVPTNVPSGTYTYTAKATDNLGATGVSAPVTITVIDRPPLTVVSSLVYNPQTDLFQQSVRVSNPTYSIYDAVRVYVYGLTNGTRLYNASSSSNGIPYVESHTAIAPGSYVDFVLEYLSPLRAMPNPILRAELVSVSGGTIIGDTTIFGVQRHINRGILLPDQTFMVEFGSTANRVYYVQYSSDLKAWNTSQPGITGNGTWYQWIDNGQPKTLSAPAITAVRFYRVIELP